MAEEGLKVGSAYVELEANASGLEADARTKVEAATADVKGHVGLVIQDEGFRAQVHAAAAAASAGEDVKLHVDVDDGSAVEKLAAVETASHAADRAGSDLWQDAGGRWRNGAGQFASSAERAAAGIDDVGTSAEGASRKIEGVGDAADRAGQKAASGSGGFLGLSGGMWGLIGAAGALAPALAALPAVMAGLGGVVGTLGLGFSGVIGTLKDYGAESTAAGQSSASLAATAFSNSLAIRNAEQAIADARRQAAQSAITSAEQVANAQRAVVDAERQAAAASVSSAQAIVSAQQQVANASYQVAQANQSLANAQYNELAAQQALTAAQQDAANVLADANNAAADAHLAVEQATLNAAAAQKNLDAVNGSSLSTADQKTAADLAARQAAQALIDAKQRDTEATQKATAANKEGAAGLPSVVSAQRQLQQATDATAAAHHGVEQAALGQQNAEKALADAQTAAANQQIASAEQVAKAQQSLADAQRSAADQQIASNEAIRRAVQNLADTQKQQALAAAAAASSGSAAVNKFATDMAKLTQPGRDFVNQLLGMKTGLHELSATAQTTMLPGFTQLLKDVTPMLPAFNTAVGQMGGVLGGLAKQFGALFNDPAFRKAFTDLLNQGTNLIAQLGPGFIGMFKGLVEAAGPAAPILSGLGKGFQDLMGSGIPDFFAGLTTNASGSGDALHGILDVVSNLIGPLGKVIGAFSGALGPAMKVLASPDVAKALTSIGESLAKILTSLTPLVTLLANGMAGALKIVAPLLDSTAKFLQDNQSWMVPLIGGIGALTAGWWLLTAAMDANPLVLITSLIAGLVAGVIYAWEHFAGFRDFIKTVWADLRIAFDAFLGFVESWWPELLAPFTFGVSEIVGHWDTVKRWFIVDIPGFFGGLLKFVESWWPELLAPFTGGISEIIGHWGDVETFVKGLPGKLASAGAHLWDWVTSGLGGLADTVGGIFKTVIDNIIGGINWAIDQVNGLTGGISSAWDWVPGTSDIPNIPHIPKLAKGGTATSPGFAIVGDAGPELMFMPAGAKVQPLSASERAAGLAGTGKTVTNHVTVQYYGTQYPTAEQQAIMMRDLAMKVSA